MTVLYLYFEVWGGTNQGFQVWGCNWENSGHLCPFWQFFDRLRTPPTYVFYTRMLSWAIRPGCYCAQFKVWLNHQNISKRASIFLPQAAKATNLYRGHARLRISTGNHNLISLLGTIITLTALCLNLFLEDTCYKIKSHFAVFELDGSNLANLSKKRSEISEGRVACVR